MACRLVLALTSGSLYRLGEPGLAPAFTACCAYSLFVLLRSDADKRRDGPGVSELSDMSDPRRPVAGPRRAARIAPNTEGPP